MRSYRLRIITAILLCCIMAGVGAWRSVQVNNLVGTVRMLEATRSLQAVTMHERLEAMHQKDALLEDTVGQCRAALEQLFGQLQLCVHHYNQCIAETSADTGGSEGNRG